MHRGRTPPARQGSATGSPTISATAAPAAVSPSVTAALPRGRVASACLVVFVANGALLVLQLVAGRLLAPFLGVSLATWTAVIGVFLAGISLGNWLGGKLADRAASERTLRWLLFGGALSTLLMLGLVYALGDGGVLRPVSLYPRIALLTLAVCLPPSLVLSLITPVAIKLMLPDVTHTGRVAGLVYALGTVGSLVGNFLTGFVLLAYLATHTIVLGTAGLLALMAILARTFSPPSPAKPGEGGKRRPRPLAPHRLRDRLRRQLLLDGPGDRRQPAAGPAAGRVAV